MLSTRKFAQLINSIRLTNINQEEMETLKYKVIKTKKQYNEYCAALEELTDLANKKKEKQDEIELLSFLIEKWDEEHNSFATVDPVSMLKSLMTEHGMNATELASSLGVSKGLVSDILHYKKGMSKEVIRNLAVLFKVSQEAFNRPYKLKLALNAHLRNASVMNTTKVLSTNH